MNSALSWAGLTQFQKSLLAYATAAAGHQAVAGHRDGVRATNAAALGLPCGRLERAAPNAAAAAALGKLKLVHLA